MSYFLVPISNLLLAQTLVLGNVTILPVYRNEQVEKSKIAYPDIYSIITENKGFYENSCEHLINLGIVETDNTCPNEMDLENSIYIVNRSLDYIKINFCRLDIRDTLVGIPGIVYNKRYVSFYNSQSRLLEEYILPPYLFSQQPGLGLDLDYLYNYRSEKLYHIFNSNRTDEVYLEYRTILSRACFAFHITDLNRCFCYLFSTVERMGGQTFMRFQDRKKRIISYISNSQHEYDVLNHQFYFYSKKVRTEIIHKGKNLSDLLPINKINELLQNLLTLIQRFCVKVISSEITLFSKLEKELENRVNQFVYEVPQNEDETEPNLGILDSGKHIFLAKIPNLDLEITLKQGNVIYLPINSVKNFSKYYRNYVYLDIIEENDLNTAEYPIIHWGKTELSLDNEFAIFTAYDLDIVLNTIKLHEVQELNQKSSIAIIIDEPFLKDTTWSFKSYSTFADIICDKISHGLDYIILSKLEINQRACLPSLAGIHDSIRGAYMLDDLENILHFIPGKVFSQYCDMPRFKIDSNFRIEDYSLFNTIFNKRTDEIAMLCKNALKRIVDCYYISDYTVQITYMFDILDMLDPQDTEGRNLKTHVLPFIAINKTDYHQKCADFKSMREKFRNPLTHYGKSIYDLTNNQSEIFNIFSYIKNIVVSYCVTITELNVTSFESLDSELQIMKTRLGI